jgi:hypothetical protein
MYRLAELTIKESMEWACCRSPEMVAAKSVIAHTNRIDMITFEKVSAVCWLGKPMNKGFWTLFSLMYKILYA